MVSVQLTISGKVQGVWFRASAEKEAQRLGLTGYVCNQANGSVYAEVEGKPELVEEFIAWSHSGPEHARVDSVASKIQPVRGYDGFEIRR